MDRESAAQPNRSRRRALARVAAVLALLRIAGQPAPAESVPPRFDRDRVSAAGRQVALLTVEQAGRYALAVESATGMSLQLVDRMAGPGEIAGQPGERDGRLDLFLDRGELRLVATGPGLGRGEARLSARPFVEQHGTALPRLRELEPVATELGDYEQRSWWLEIAKRRWVAIEAAGRHLADLRLWSESGWLLGATPERETISPTPERPLAACRLAALLEPGRYLLTAYGGPEVPWARRSEERPLHLRWGLPRRGAAGRFAGRVGPLGYDRFLVSAAADLFRLDLPEPRDAALELADFDPARPFAPGPAWTIGEESVPPETEVWRDAGEGWVLVTVRGAPGQRYGLQHFVASAERSVPGGRSYWFGSVHAGAAGDALDASALLFALPGGDPSRARLARGDGVRLTAQGAWARRFELVAAAELFVEVVEAGEVRLTARGAPARFRLEPLLFEPPEGYREPEPRLAPAAWMLDRGWYRLTALPVEPGVVEVALAGAAAADPLAGAGELAEPTPRRGATRLGPLALEPRTRYVLRLAAQPGVVAGALVRQLPLDLDDPLPIELAPGEELELPARASGPSRLVARAEGGEPLEVAAGDGGFAPTAEVGAGTVRVRVRSRSATPVAATVGFEPLASDERLAAVPGAPPPPLAAGQPVALDLARRGEASFEVAPESPALYTLETTGLLATEASLATRVRPGLAAAAENGSGRNASLATYLRAGEYRLTVRARGASAGRLGARLERTPVADGGELAEGIPARVTLGAAEAIAYRFTVARAGRYRVRAFGLSGPFVFRLEEAGGWPVVARVESGEARVDLEPGEHRLVLLPRGLPARALALVEREPEPEARAGHGPHPLALDAWQEHLWTEPDEGAAREPDRWRFSMPAATRVEVALTRGMTGELFRLDGGGAPRPGAAIVAVSPGAPAQVELEAGEYELAVLSPRRDHLAPYRLRVAPADLVAGLAREVEAPALLGVAIGGGETELESFGGDDVRARLYDAEGRPVAAADDRPDDWNFRIGAPLAPGRYLLRVDPVGAPRARTRVALAARATVEAAPWRGEPELPLELGSAGTTVPLELAAGEELVAVGAEAPRPLALRLERREGGSWIEVDAAAGRAIVVASPRGESGEWRVRVATLDGRPGRARLTRAAGRAPRVSEGELARGVRLEPLPGLAPPLAVLVVELEGPGCFVAEAGEPELRQARRAGSPFRAERGALPATGVRLWLAGVGGERLVVRRARVGEAPVELRLAPGERAVCDLAPAGAEAVVAEVSSLAGAPGVRLLGAGPGLRPDRAAAVAPPRAIALGAGAPAGGALQAEVWNGGREELEVRLGARALEPLGVGLGAPGGSELRLLPFSLERLRLPAAAAVRVTIDAGGLARFGPLASDGPLLWAAAGAAVEWGPAAGEVVLANPTPAPVAARVEILPDGERATLDGEGRFQRSFERAGSLTLDLPAGKGARRVEVHGARATLVDGGGEIGRAEESMLSAAGGRLRLEHGPGRVAVQLVDPAFPSDPRRGEPPPWLGATLQPLQEGLGEATLLAPGERRAYRFTMAREGPVGLGARSGSGRVECRLYRAEGGELGRGVVIWRRLEAGDYVLALEAPADGVPEPARPALVGSAPAPTGPPPEIVRAFAELERGAPGPPAAATAGTEAPRRELEGFRRPAPPTGELEDEPEGGEAPEASAEGFEGGERPTPREGA